MPENQQISAFARLYRRIILRHPLLVVLAFAAGLIFFGYHLGSFRMDASSDSLVLENDAAAKIVCSSFSVPAPTSS